MKDELQSRIYSEDPVFFRESDMDMTKTCMCWGIECDDGWYEPILEFVKSVSVLNSIVFSKNARIVCNQMKQKYGEIRIYWTMEFIEEREGNSFDDDFFRSIDYLMSAAVEKCENACANTCEICGSHEGVKPSGGWITMKCEDCEKKHSVLNRG